jgi:hypothetical protein
MDLAVSSSFAIAAALALNTLHGSKSTPSATGTFMLALIAYLTIKILRITVYSSLFSPLRRVPGPKV